MVFELVIGTAFALLVGSRVLWRLRTYEGPLQDELQKRGCTLESVRIPKLFDTGPFPLVSVRRGGVRVVLLGVHMTHEEYRAVTFRDPQGQQHTRWVKLVLSPLGLHAIEWEPGEANGFPPNQSRPHACPTPDR